MLLLGLVVVILLVVVLSTALFVHSNRINAKVQQLLARTAPVASADVEQQPDYEQYKLWVQMVQQQQLQHEQQQLQYQHHHQPPPQQQQQPPPPPHQYEHSMVAYTHNAGRMPSATPVYAPTPVVVSMPGPATVARAPSSLMGQGSRRPPPSPPTAPPQFLLQ